MERGCGYVFKGERCICVSYKSACYGILPKAFDLINGTASGYKLY